MFEDDPHIFVKTVTVYWDYNNVFPKYNDKIAYHGNTVKFEEGYRTFSMIKDRFTYELGTTVLKANKYDNTCSLEVDGDVHLSKFGELLGFREINRGLPWVTLHYSLV